MCILVTLVLQIAKCLTLFYVSPVCRDTGSELSVKANEEHIHGTDGCPSEKKAPCLVACVVIC